MASTPSPGRLARRLAALFAFTTLLLVGALVWSWMYTWDLLKAGAPPPPPLLQVPALGSGPASPLQVHYQIDLPGRGEIFPALAAGNPADYWPVALLTITNASDRPLIQTISAEIPGWSTRAQQTIVLGAYTTQRLDINPDLLPRAYDNREFRRASLEVHVRGPQDVADNIQQRPLFIHSASDLYWGRRFSNAQFIARWVSPQNAAVIRLVASAKKYVPNGRLPGYNSDPQANGSQKTDSQKKDSQKTDSQSKHSQSKYQENEALQVRRHARAIFEALKKSGISYVSSIFTFGDFSAEAQRVRLPEETLTLSIANCVDVSVAFASAIENLGMDPAIVIVPGHAFAGVRLGRNTQDRLYLDLTVLPKGSFEQAIARAQHWLDKIPADQVIVVDIAAARALRIYPIPDPERQANIMAEKLPASPSQPR